jgi:hypothetical protein
METINFKVEVNPFLRMAIVKTNINDCEYSFGLFYNELDEWNSFSLDGKDYDIHFLYDDKFSVSIYPLHSNYDNSCIVELTIKLNNK